MVAQRNSKKKIGTRRTSLRILDLPGHVLDHSLSLLPSHEVVRTCVLSKSWRHVWKSVPALRFTGSIADFKIFVDKFLASRGNATIFVCDVEFTDEECVEMLPMHEWIFHVVSVCSVQELRVIVRFEDEFLWLHNLALVSKHLRIVDLEKVHLEQHTVDFSSCPALEDINMISCCIEAKKFISKSLKRVTTEHCEFSGGLNFTDEFSAFKNIRIHLCTPNIVSLKLLYIFGQTPFIEGMPLLEDACIRFVNECSDCCYYNTSGGCDNMGAFGCPHMNNHGDASVLLEGLSNATHLELVNEQPNMVIIKRELQRCPIFKNLRTLILNSWFVDNNLHGVITFLCHSPVLEKLLLLLFEEPKKLTEANGCHNKMERPFAVEHLNEVKIKCQKKHEWVTKTISILTTFGITFDKIITEETSELS